MSRSLKPGNRSLGAIFGIPLLLGLVSGIGLVAALLTEGLFDLLWSLAVATPLLVMIRVLWPRWAQDSSRR